MPEQKAPGNKLDSWDYSLQLTGGWGQEINPLSLEEEGRHRRCGQQGGQTHEAARAALPAIRPSGEPCQPLAGQGARHLPRRPSLHRVTLTSQV